MAIGVHFVRLGLFTVDANGARVDKTSGTSINTLKSTSMEFLVIPDSAIGTTANYPTIKVFLQAEASADYVLHHLDQSIIVTYNQSQINSA